jgi:putative acyl-CoA dehydrogenase
MLTGGRAQSALRTGGASGDAGQPGARRLAAMIAVVLSAALLVRHAPAAVADAFCASRLGPGSADGPGGPGGPFGMLPDGLDLASVLDRARTTIPG